MAMAMAMAMAMVKMIQTNNDQAVTLTGLIWRQR